MSRPIVLPALNLVDRWQECHKANCLLKWRALAFLCSSAGLVARHDGNTEAEQNCVFLFEIAMQHVFFLSNEYAEAA